MLRRRVRHQVTENARVADCVAALEAGDWAAVGRLFDASHVSLRDDYEVSCAELDLVVATAREAGALGARMTGGGFGGSAIALVAVERADAVRRAVDAAFVGGRVRRARPPRRHAVGSGVPGGLRVAVWSQTALAEPGKCVVWSQTAHPRGRRGQVALTPISPSRKAATKRAWSSRTRSA